MAQMSVGPETNALTADPGGQRRTIQDRASAVSRGGPAMTETPHNPPDLVEAFLRRERLAPNMAAVDDGRVVVTYGELSARAHQFAGSIQRGSSGASPRVLLALPPSSSAYAAMIGTLIAGGTF